MSVLSMFSGVMELYSGVFFIWSEWVLSSRTNHLASVPDLTNALVTEYTQTLTAMFQHVE